MLHRAQSLLAHYFGYEKFRSGQDEAIRLVTEAGKIRPALCRREAANRFAIKFRH